MTDPISPAIRVLIVDDQQLLRDGLASLLKLYDSIEVVGTAANGQEAVEQALILRPDMILMDIRMPIMNGIAATSEILGKLKNCRVLVLTTFDDDEYIVKALLSGASGYLLKNIPAQDLARAIELTHRGIYTLEPSVAGKLVGALKDTTHPSSNSSNKSRDQNIPPIDLTERELEVLQLIAFGASNREIAEKLVITEGTVKTHVSNILGRLGVRDRVQAAIFAREHNLF
jgi:DNA-binding NarL/FixJ family response regulator